MDYREFLPKKYIKRKKEEKIKSYKRILVMLILYNIYLLPINFSYLTREHDISVVEEFYIEGSAISDEEIFRWLEVNSMNYIEFKASDGVGDIKFKDKVDLYGIESAGFEIKEVKNSEDGYEIKVK